MKNADRINDEILRLANKLFVPLHFCAIIIIVQFFTIPSNVY